MYKSEEAMVMSTTKYIDESLINKYEFYSYGHALEILYEAYPTEWRELQNCLRNFRLTIDDIEKAGGNESPIPKKFDDELYPFGWREIRIVGDLVVKKYPRQTAQRRGNFAFKHILLSSMAEYDSYKNS